MSAPLTVLQLVPALDAGGVERGTIEIADALVRAGHRALVVSAGGRLVADLKAVGAEHVLMPIGAKRPWVLGQIKPLQQLIQRERVDVVHARSRLPAWIGWRALRRIAKHGDRPAFVTTLHGINSVSRYSSIMTRGDRVIAVSNSCLHYWARHYPAFDASAATVVHRGVDPAEFPFAYQPGDDWRQGFFAEYDIPSKQPILTLPGRLTGWKGQREFIELIARLTQGGRPVQGLLVGGAEDSKSAYLKSLRAMAVEAGVDEAITFTGHRRDMREIYAASDIVFSLSSKPEAFGRVVTEALALGTPVIGWDHGGAGESLATIFPSGRVPLGDLDGLLERTIELLDKPQQIPNEQPFLKSVMQAKTLSLYESLCASAGTTATSMD